MSKLPRPVHRSSLIFLTRCFNVKTTFFSAFARAYVCAAGIIVVGGTNDAFAQAPIRADKSQKAAVPAPTEKIMTIAELRACMMIERANKKAAAEILREQDNFKRDQDAVKAEQVAVNKANDEIRGRSTTIVSEREALSTLLSALAAKGQAAKTDEEKAELGVERSKLVERSRQLEQTIDSFNASQQAMADRVAALNARIDAVNQRNQTVNDRVEPQQKRVAEWREQCGNRRFREEDEVLIKKELAATP